MKKFFGFAFSAAMLPTGSVSMEKTDLTAEEVKELLPDCEICLNPSHVATIEVAKARFGFVLAIPEVPPRVSLKEGDSVIVMQVRGLPRLTDRHEFTSEEIASATFSFMEISVK